MKKIFFSDKIKTLFFVGFLIIFAFFLFNQNVSAETYFAEDFESYNIGDGQSVLRNNYNWFYYSSNSFRGVVSDHWYSSPNQSFNYSYGSYSEDVRFDINLDTPVSVGSFFFTINQAGKSTNPGTEIDFRSELSIPSSPRHMFRIYIPDVYESFSISDINSNNQVVNTYTYDTPFFPGVDYNFRLDVNFITDKYSIYINNDLVADDVSFPTLQSFTSIKAFTLNLKCSTVGAQYYIDDIYLTDGSNPFTFNLPFCGSDAGKLIETTPVNLCDSGTAGTVSFDGSKWNWDCISGVVSQSCRAYLATTEPVDGTCGAWNGETFNTWPPLAELCELRTSLVVPSMVETINGYTWTCSGINGGTSDYCSGNKTSPPLMPELPGGSLDDCSGLSILEGLVCNMGNTLKTIFLPSSEKINELNQTINKMASKFPFSYISKATEAFNDVKGNITETSMLELSIMGSEKSSIDFSTIAFFDYIKMLTTILIIIVFSFWLIRFIKHIF